MVRTMSFAQARRRWEAALSAQWARGAWPEPPQPGQLAIPDRRRPQTPAAPSTVEAARARMAPILAGMRAGGWRGAGVQTDLPLHRSGDSLDPERAEEAKRRAQAAVEAYQARQRQGGVA